MIKTQDKSRENVFPDLNASQGAEDKLLPLGGEEKTALGAPSDVLCKHVLVEIPVFESDSTVKTSETIGIACIRQSQLVNVMHRVKIHMCIYLFISHEMCYTTSKFMELIIFGVPGLVFNRRGVLILI